MMLAVMALTTLFPTASWAAAPVVGSVAFTSQPGPDRTYGEQGDAILITVAFDQAVYVTGLPNIKLKLGETVGQANYQLGSGSAHLVFGYTIAPGEFTTAGVAVEAGSIALNGGTIQNQAGEAAVLAHPGLVLDADHMVDRRCVLDAGLVSLSGTFDIVTSDNCLIPVQGRPDPPGLELHWQSPAGAEHVVVFLDGDSEYPRLDTTTVGVVNGTRHGVDDGIVCNALGECGGNDDYHAPFRFEAGNVDNTGGHVYAAYQYGRRPGAFGTATLHVTLVPRVTGVEVADGACRVSPSLTWDAPPDLGRSVSWVVLLTQDAEAFPKRRGRPGVIEVAQPRIVFSGLAVDQTYYAKVLPQVEALGSGGYLETGQADSAQQVSFTVQSPPVLLSSVEDLVLRAGAPVADDALSMPQMSRDCGPYTYELCLKTDVADGTCASIVLPSGLTFDPANGSLAGTPAGAEPGAEYVYTVRNSHGYAVSGEFSLAVAGPGREGDSVPSITSLRFDSEPATASQGYTDAEVISLEVEFDQPVHVSRRSAITLTMGDEERQLVYVDGSETDKLKFAYTVTACDSDADGVSVAASAFDLAGGVVVSDIDRTVLANLTHASLDGSSGHRVAAFCPGQ